MQNSAFYEVFPTISLQGELKDLMEHVTVYKVTTNRDHTFIHIYLECDRLILKPVIYELEREIKEQLFSNEPVTIKVMEQFHLSSQYTLEKLCEIYMDSIMLEIKQYNRMMGSVLKKAKIELRGEDEIHLTIEENLASQEYLPEILRILEKIFCERLGIPANITYEFVEAVESKYRKHGELRVEQQILAIMNRNAEYLAEKGNGEAVAEGQNNQEKKEEPKKAETSAAKPVQAAKKPGAVVGEKGKFEKKTMGNGGQNYTRPLVNSNNPDVIYGKDFEDEVITIDQIITEMGEVVVRGCIRKMDEREIRGEKTIIMMDITDYTDSISVKIFTKNEQLPELKAKLKTGAFIKVKGIALNDRFDHEVSIQSVSGIKTIPDFTVKRMDMAAEKRVELHCHTKMSDMDGVSDAGSIIKRAISWGHKALAITDHGAVQGFTDALHCLQKVEGKFKWEPFDFKVIYGVEAYLVDDLKTIVTNEKGQNLDDKYVVFDLETTGFSPDKNKIIEIGAVKVENGEIIDRYSTFVNPHEPIPFHIENLTKINDSMVVDARSIEEILPEFLEFSRDCVMVAHNADFDMSFIIKNCNRLGLSQEFTYVDTVALARMLLPALNNAKLNTVAKALNISLENHHRAVDDAGCTAEIMVKFIEMLKARNIHDLHELNEKGTPTDEMIRKMKSHHAIILATSEVGRVNLYRLVSNSNIRFFHRQPKIPKSDFLAHREGLIIGSACEAGELFQAILGGRSEQEIARLVNFYDYLEIQPIGNNSFMLRKDEYGVKTEEDLRDFNREIVRLGEQFGKPVVATCDVHFLDPEDEVYRRIIMAGKGFDDADDQAPLYLRTTEEMLEEFKYLGSDKAEEVVITNPNKIADMVDNILPVSPKKCPPVIENSDEDLRSICYNKAHSMYGEDLPEIVVERLERELNSIISNGFAVMYIIAQKLVWKSNEDGYLVGSRGSVGSSFVATMAGITEVNPLRPHYYCTNCHFSDFDSPEVLKYSGGAGCDMPDRDCPKCGQKLVKDGFDIPFETFLGFKGNKEPDIDLNFSGEYQSKAHEYTEVIFGKGQTFRAGTIGTLAEKTAYGYVKHYFEERGSSKRKSEIERIAEGCVGVRRTTGQHPGGIIVLPYGNDINTFTPVQHPANDMTTKTITTHFDYHSIDHNLLKLDILGHDDPTMIRMLEDITGIDAKKIPLDDQKVMSLFASPEALGVTPEELRGCRLGSLGIPEFGTDFVIQMLIDTQPKTFSDLVRISGLSHGTDVWLGNAQTLIAEGNATISTAICTRDDIMTYLIYMGMESELSFTIMESVRKGKGLKPEWEEAMKAANVPDWYIWSCKKIKYMFPKAHAAAYVMMAFRIAYFKIYYPLAYYAAFFSIRAKAFSYELMCQGKERLEYFMDDYTKRNENKELSQKEEETLKDMKIVQEMYARGFEFHKLDLFKADAHRFQVMDGKLMPSLSSIDGMGDKAAEGVAEAAKDGAFLSKDDFRQRAKVSKTLIDQMSSLGLLEDLPETNQLSLFDMM